MDRRHHRAAERGAVMTALPPSVHGDFLAALAAARTAIHECSGVEALAVRLYQLWYSAPVAADGPPFGIPPRLDSLLRSAHAGSGIWENGWEVEHTGRDGQVIARKGGERRVLHRCDYIVPEHPGLVAKPRDHVRVSLRYDYVDVEGGWWFTHSPGWQLDAPPGPLVRFYWNVGVAQVATVVERITSAMLSNTTPWMLKCATDPDAYRRADVVVLYMLRSAVVSLSQRLGEVRAHLRPVLRAGSPPLTFGIARGVAACDDPATGASFGQHRCTLIAEAVLGTDADSTLAESPDALLDAIVMRFRDAGIPPDRPYLADKTRRLPWE